MKRLLSFGLIVGFLVSSAISQAADLKEGDMAPAIHSTTQSGEAFDLQSRKGQWTILYFYPKAETPGCTKQACGFRDGIDKIRKLGADVVGISVNSVKDQAEFAKNHQLNFTLLADENAEVTKLYGVKMPVLQMAKRWTFVLDPDLKIRLIEKDVDPVKDADKMVANLTQLQAH